MTFTGTRIPGVVVIEPDVFRDERGFFTPIWMSGTFEARGLGGELSQSSIASNRKRGTIRGLHYQAAPAAQIKWVRVIRGAVFDVAVDLRTDSPTFRQWIGVELSAENGRMLYIPKGLAHGYQTLADDAEVLYLASSPYSPSHERGVRWNDPAFGIEWPLGQPSCINARDAGYADFHAAPR
jgi:dTDP-4-dehydrorhamnose 3,5-epimerase